MNRQKKRSNTLFLKMSWTISRTTEKCCIHKSAYLQGDQDKEENVAMACIDYKTADDIVPQTYQVINGNYENWKLKLTARRKTLVVVKIQRSIFQVDSLSLQLFLIAMMPLINIISKCTGAINLQNRNI